MQKYRNDRKVQKECHASPEGGADIPQYTTNKDVLVFGLFFGHGVFCTIDERKVQKEYHTSPQGADIPPYPASKDIMISGLFSGTVIAVAGDVVFTARGGR